MISTSAIQTEQIGQTLATVLPPATKVVTLTGDLGAGKTTFARGFATGWGVTSPVSSPSYAIVNEYDGARPLFHFDWYRLSGAEEVFDLDFALYLSRGLCLVEWSERAPEALPTETVHVVIRKGDAPDTRLIDVEGCSI